MEQKLTILDKVSAVDQNIRELYDALGEAEQKSLKSDLYILNRWYSSVRGSAQMQQHFVILVNEYYNKHFFSLVKHPKLQWLLLCMCNYDGVKTFNHEWISLSKKADTSGKVAILTQLYPQYNTLELELLSNKISNEEVVELAVAYDIDVTSFAKKYKIDIEVSTKPKRAKKKK